MLARTVRRHESRTQWGHSIITCVVNRSKAERCPCCSSLFHVLLSSSAQVKQEVGSILGLLLPLTRNLSSPERSEALDQQGDMQAMLLQLKGVAQNLALVSSTQVV